MFLIALFDASSVLPPSVTAAYKFLVLIHSSADGVTARGVTATEPYTGCIRNLESRDPGRDAKTLFLTKPLQMAGDIYLGGCPFI